VNSLDRVSPLYFKALHTLLLKEEKKEKGKKTWRGIEGVFALAHLAIKNT